MAKIGYISEKKSGLRRRKYVEVPQAKARVHMTETSTLAPSLGQVVGLFERLYREGKLELMTARERRAQVTQAISDAEAFHKNAEQRLKKLKSSSL